MSAIIEPKHEQNFFIPNRVLAETLPWRSKINWLTEKAKTKAEVKRDWLDMLFISRQCAESSAALICTAGLPSNVNWSDERKYNSNQVQGAHSAIQLLFKCFSSDGV